MKKSLSECPSCSELLVISQYHCKECDIEINGEFEGCTFCGLKDEDRYFALIFLQTGGNISDVEKVMGISYPTVKAKLNQLLERLSLNPENGGGHAHNRKRERMVFHFGHGEQGDLGDKISAKVEKKVRKALEKAQRKIEGVTGGIHEAVEDATSEIHIHREDNGKNSPDPELVKSVLEDLKAGRINASEATRKIKGEGISQGNTEDADTE